MNREEWLNRAAKALAPWFAKNKVPNWSPIYVSVGIPKGRANAIGQCWAPQKEDGEHHIFICPRLEDPFEVLATLAHELVHVTAGCECGHKGAFKVQGRAIGLEGKLTATTVGRDTEFGQFLLKVSEKLGPYPHKKLEPKRKSTRKSMGGWLRMQSTNDEKYKVLISPKQLDLAGAPVDPWGDEMVLCGEEGEE